MKNPKCCICGKECENQWGNNPYPLSKNENDRCCDECNMQYVIAARMLHLNSIEDVKKYLEENEEK